jgi:hypothetical protein
MCPFDCMSAPVGGNSTKIQTSHSLRMRYKTCKFPGNPSTITGTLLGGQYAFWAYLGFHSRDFPEDSYFALSTHAQWDLGCDRLVIKNTLPGQQCAFSATPIAGTFLKLYSLHPPHMRYKPCKLGCDRSIIKSTSPSRLYLGFHSRNLSADSYLALYTHALQTVQVWIGQINHKKCIQVFKLATVYFISNMFRPFIRPSVGRLLSKYTAIKWQNLHQCV